MPEASAATSPASTTLVSASSTGDPANAPSDDPSMSADGRYVVFESTASNLVSPDPGPSGGDSDIFLKSTADNSIRAVSKVGCVPGSGNASCDSTHPSISADGRWVAFASYDWTLVPNDGNGMQDVFLADMSTTPPLYTRVSVSSSGAQADGQSWTPALSSTGRYVVFQSFATSPRRG